jgi:histidinol dehydrogenase
MEIIDWHAEMNPPLGGWGARLSRPSTDFFSLERTVGDILHTVKEQGDEAVRRYTLMFDKVRLENFEVTENEISEAAALIPEELKSAIDLACANINAFHKIQSFNPSAIEILPGLTCWRRNSAIEKVGLYIPGGTAPLFSTLLMLGIPAAIAGCKEVIVCSPPDTAGRLHPAILYSARLVGVTRIFRVGGVQAIGAMAYGTQTIPKLYKIFGPGNQYVMCAKQLIQKEGVAIDMPAGPSELLIYADQTANPAYLAADLLSQAEHGVDSQVILVCNSATLIEQVNREIQFQLENLPRKSIATRALEKSKAVIVKDVVTAMNLVNEYAPEHLILACEKVNEIASMVINAGSVFLGHYSPESAGDYTSGTNHVLPTNGYARVYSGVSVDSFVKKISFQQLTGKALQSIGPAVEIMATAEGLQAHARAVSIRLKDMID